MTEIPTRQEVRQAFAGLLQAELVGDGKLAKAVYAYRVGDFGGETPVLALGSGGTEIQTLSLRNQRQTYMIDLFIFVLYALLDDEEKLVVDAQGQPVWDEQNAEDTLDAIEAEVRTLIERSKNLPYWQAITPGGPSQTEVVAIGGMAYYLEVMPLRFVVY